MVLREIVAEPTLDARRALVRRVQLDVRGRDADHLAVRHVEIDLTTDAAVRADRANGSFGMADLVGREPLARHRLEDGAGRTHPDALAAPRAARLVGVPVGTDDDLGVLAPLADVEHADHLDVLAGPDAPGAEDAGAHVVPDHRVAGALIAMTERQVAITHRRRDDSVTDDVAFELVARPGPPPHRTAVPQVIPGVALEQQAEHALAVLDCRVRLRVHDHPIGDLRGARRQELALSFHGHEADPAVTHVRQLGIPAQGGDVRDSRGARGLENRLFGIGGNRAAVDGEGRHEFEKLRGEARAGQPPRRLTVGIPTRRAGSAPALNALSRCARADVDGCGPRHPTPLRR